MFRVSLGINFNSERSVFGMRLWESRPFGRDLVLLNLEVVSLEVTHLDMDT